MFIPSLSWLKGGILFFRFKCQMSGKGQNFPCVECFLSLPSDVVFLITPAKDSLKRRDRLQRAVRGACRLVRTSCSDTADR